MKFRSFAVGGVPPEVMGIGPVEAIPRALKLAGLQPQDIGLFELNEAFASQAIQVIRELGIDEEKVNVNGAQSHSDTRSAVRVQSLHSH